MAEPRIHGTVTRVILTRGFGFIRNDRGEEWFMHVDDFLNVEDWEGMKAGKQVEFLSSETTKGLRAREVRVC